MCRATTCKKCGKASWAGCGQHVDQVLAGVPRADRCPGHPRESGSGFFGRLFGRPVVNLDRAVLPRQHHHADQRPARGHGLPM